MNKDIAMKWADALESGEYQQIKYFLHTADGYCCLGVLCELSGISTWKPDDGGAFRYPDTSFYESSKYTLPIQVQHWAELKSPGGDLTEDETLASLNDSGRTFQEIAQVIRENWENL